MRPVFSAVRFFTTLLLFSSLITLPEFAVAAASPRPDKKSLSKDQRVIQVLSRLTFGAKPGEFERVKKIGVNAFIEEQLSPDNIDDSSLAKKLEKLPTLNLSTPIIAEQYNPPKPKPTPTPTAPPANTATSEAKPEQAKSAIAIEPAPVTENNPSPTPAPKPTPVPKNPYMVVTELQRAKLLRAVYSERQLYEVMVDFWENHFSIYANKDANRWLLTSFDRDSVRPYAMGRFRDLLGATARSPAMLFYLDNWQSSLLREYPATKDKPARTSGGVNENYARELMELHTLGVDGGYTQKDVQEVARCFTGWTIRKPNEEGIFVYNPAMHDNGEKTVLGVKIPAGGGIADGERVLDILAKHPATARFVATKMARRFFGDKPSAAVVDRAAKVFLSTDGSITETLRNIITSPSFFSSSNFRTKVKSPFEFVASALRITGAETDANRPVLDWIGKMGQPVYGRITPDGYPDFSSEWLSNNDLLARFNFASAFALNTIKGTTVAADKFLTDANDGATASKQVERSILFDQASAQTRGALEKLAADTEHPPAQPAAPLPIPAAAKNWAPPKPEDKAKALTGQLVALALGAPEFQRK
jgi:uncharacterized protein (DUF1800 family)